nr:ATPase ASNA1 homolog [Ipomoea batatas]
MWDQVFVYLSPCCRKMNDNLQQLRSRMAKVRDLFHDTEATKFVIVTIPALRHRSALFTNLPFGLPLFTLFSNFPSCFSDKGFVFDILTIENWKSDPVPRWEFIFK